MRGVLLVAVRSKRVENFCWTRIPVIPAVEPWLALYSRSGIGLHLSRPVENLVETMIEPPRWPRLHLQLCFEALVEGILEGVASKSGRRTTRILVQVPVASYTRTHKRLQAHVAR